MCLMMISPKVKKRFPKIDNLVEAGLLLPNEKDIIDDLRLENYPGHSLHLYVNIIQIVITNNINSIVNIYIYINYLYLN